MKPILNYVVAFYLSAGIVACKKNQDSKDSSVVASLGTGNNEGTDIDLTGTFNMEIACDGGEVETGKITAVDNNCNRLYRPTYNPGESYRYRACGSSSLGKRFLLKGFICQFDGGGTFNLTLTCNGKKSDPKGTVETGKISSVTNKCDKNMRPTLNEGESYYGPNCDEGTKRTIVVTEISCRSTTPWPARTTTGPVGGYCNSYCACTGGQTAKITAIHDSYCTGGAVCPNSFTVGAQVNDAVSCSSMRLGSPNIYKTEKCVAPPAD